MCIKEIENTKAVKDVCNNCNEGLLLIDNIGELNEQNIILSFICSNCNKYRNVKVKIDSYFEK